MTGMFRWLVLIALLSSATRLVLLQEPATLHGETRHTSHRQRPTRLCKAITGAGWSDVRINLSDWRTSVVGFLVTGPRGNKQIRFGAKRYSRGIVNRDPVRVIHDPYATYSAVTVDSVRNEIILQDENLFQIKAQTGWSTMNLTMTCEQPLLNGFALSGSHSLRSCPSAPSKEASLHFLEVASTPPVSGGEFACSTDSFTSFIDRR